VDLNTKGRYAVMAMADLAKYGKGSAIPLSAIAERQQISLAYLEQLFVRLRRAGLVESARGRSGGYRLLLPASQVTVAEVMAAVEEDVRMTRCAGEHGAPCLAGARCLTHGLWEALGDEISRFLSRVSLQDVLDGIPLAAAEKVTPVPAAQGEAAPAPGTPRFVGRTLE
jgi:Rrf2 family protein